MLIETLRRDQLTARKNKEADTASLLTTLISEAAMVGKNADNRESTDDEVLATIRKFVKNATETRTALMVGAGSPDAIAKVDAEIAVLTGYLPQQLDQKQLTRLIEDFVERTPGAQMKDVMGFLSREHKGLYDGKAANGIATAVIKQASEA